MDSLTPKPSRHHRIDTHAHYLPPFYRDALIENGHQHPDGMPAVPEWSSEAHLKMMDELNISKSYLSISSPACHLHPTTSTASLRFTRDLARQCNAYGSSLVKQHPDRFGFFATLPLPDVEASLEEIDIALADGAAGFCLMTNAQGMYLGDPRFAPLFAEFERRRAVVFIHPTTPCGACPSLPGHEPENAVTDAPLRATPLSELMPNPMFEFMFDTCRSLTSLLLSGTISLNPNITFLIPHCGGTFPPLLPRITGFASVVPGQKYYKLDEDGAREVLRKQVYWDCAGWAFPGMIKSLKECLGDGVGPERLLYGSDYPFTPAGGVEMFLNKMENSMKEMDWNEEKEQICWRNAEALFGKKSTG